MQIEDPRIRYKQLQNERCSTESITMQPLHGSPYHVYPASNFPAVKAFQGPNSSLQSVSASPLLSTKSQIQMEMSPIMKQGSPHGSRIGNIPRRQTIQETSFTNNFDTDAVVAKINNMFPTASDDHIRLLLKKYLKTVFPKADETMLLDILANSDNNVQTASETLLAMGYQKREMAPPKLTNRSETLKKEDTSISVHPKVLTLEEKNAIRVRLQQRYKNIAERIITMALESVSFSEDRALQILQIVQQEDETKAKNECTSGDVKKVDEMIREESQPTSDSKFTRNISSTASHPSLIFQSSSCELPTATTKSQTSTSKINHIVRMPRELPCSSTPTEGVKKAEKYRFRAKHDLLKSSPRDCIEDEVHFNKKPGFKSIIRRVDSKGHNPEITKGPDDSLLLADYITWNGANPDFPVGHKHVATGHNPNLLSERTFTTHGRNFELCKGPNADLPTGSIYSQLNNNLTANVKCN